MNYSDIYQGLNQKYCFPSLKPCSFVNVTLLMMLCYNAKRKIPIEEIKVHLDQMLEFYKESFDGYINKQNSWGIY